MSILDRKLSDAKIGSKIRFIQQNGNTIEGIVTENDGTDSVSIQVSSIVTIRYSQIAGIETFTSGETETVPTRVTEPDKDKPSARRRREINFSCSESDVKASFKAMDSDARSKLNPVFGKIQSALKSHESAKLTEAAELCWNIMTKNRYEENPEVNAFYACVCVLDGYFSNAAISFRYADNLRNAYLSAYYGAEKGNSELYELAAAFSALYISEGNTENLDEAAEILAFSSAECNDISALTYILSNDIPREAMNAIFCALEILAEKCGKRIDRSDSPQRCMEIIRPYYHNEKINDIIKDYEKEPEKEEIPPQTVIVTPAPPEPPKEWYSGTITSYNYFEGNGTIEDEDGRKIRYELDGIADASLKTKLGKIKSKKDFKPSFVKFKAARKMSMDYAVEIKINKEIKETKEPEPVTEAVTSPNLLYSQGKYEEAIAGYRKNLSAPDWENSFAQIIMCYLALWNKNGDMGYSDELNALTEKYGDRELANAKTYETLYQYYFRIHDYSKALSALNGLIEACDSHDFNRILNCLLSKSRCYRCLHDYQSAIGQLRDWLDIVKRNALTERYDTRKSLIYIELAELYFEAKDYASAEKFAKDSSGSEERKNALLDKINALTKKEEEYIDDETDEDDEDGSDDTTAMTLREAYDEYIDDGEIDFTDADVVEKISSFDRKHLYCLLTWLSAAAATAKKTTVINLSSVSSEYTVTQAVQSIESMFSYAYRNPLAECEYTSTQVISIFETARKFMPQYSEGLMISAVLRTLFNPDMQDYYLDDLIIVVEHSDISSEYPMLENLLTAVKSFYETTGCALDAFAGYRSNVNVIDSVIKEAAELCTALDFRSESFETQGQVRRLRGMMFSDENSELRKCLNIVAENNTSEIKYVRSCMEKMFIRSNKPLTAENADIIKIDALIDYYWDKARDMILSEKRHVERPHDKIKGSKRNNIINYVKKIISCVCDWLAVAEHSGNNDEAYIKQKYDAIAPQIITMLDELRKTGSEIISRNGFDWGTDSIKTTAEELLSKMNGSYNAKSKKYFFIGFLSGEDILLDDDYLPELRSTFCKWGRMNILSRIERHASENHFSFEERISQILSDDETKHNFRTIRLIKAYAEDTENTALAENKEFEQLNACLKQAKKRFESVYQDFSVEMELFESKGVISDTNGEKTSILKLALDWYRITRITNDFGFYARMLNYIRNHISVNAAEKGQSLMRRLEELADNPKYDFGVYPKELIEEFINDQNYTVAEFMLNCIVRGDTKAVPDFSREPRSYFNDFVDENSINYRAVFGAGKSIVEKIYEYSGKKDLEKALLTITNNARKETKGGAELLRNWLPKGGPAKVEDLQRLLERLGFDPVSITGENSSSIESYKVLCRKRSGKVIYPHCIPAFGSLTETDGFRIACLYGKFDCNSLMNSFRMMNTTAKHTLVLLDYALNMEERRRLARKIKEEKSFSKTFIVVDRVVLFYLAKHYAADTVARRFMAVTLPFAYYQPFIEASTQTMPAELFTGRDAELTSIESPEGANLVYGGRQLGKSALLKMAQHNIDKNGNNDRAVLLDIQYKNYKEAAKLLSQELITRDILDPSCECDNWDDLARHIKKRLMDENPDTRINYLLIMLDEADEFIKTSAADDNPPIAAVKNLPAGRFKLVMAGLHNLSRFNREMLQGNSNLIHLSSVVIKQFQRPEAIKLLTNTLAYLGFRFDEKVISLILAKTNYYPGLIQFYCQKLLEAMKADDYAGYSETNTPCYEVTEGHIKKVLSDSAFMNKVNEKLEASLFTEEKGHSRYHIIALIFAYLCYDAPAEKKYTVDDLMRVAREYKITRLTSLNREKIEELLNEMWDLNVLSKEEEYYRFATEGFRELLGSREQVEDCMSEYFEEVIE
ncbi:MAG: hypothetical protein IJ666_07960 [Ruminococcus sp.]|nr:hypothetical protein [Ruminococcus sp.]